jgi:hypothetical protein
VLKGMRIPSDPYYVQFHIDFFGPLSWRWVEMIFPQKNERVIAEKIYPTDPTVENLMLYIKYIYNYVL